MPDDAFALDPLALKAALDRGYRLDDIENVVPVIVPRSVFEAGNWPGPYALLRHAQLGLTWGILAPGNVMTDVDHERAALWEREGIDWRARAISNLVERSRHELWTYDRPKPSTGFVFVAMMQADGLGS